MKQLVRLRMRQSRNGRSFTYFLDYIDADGKRQRPSLHHADRRKAEKQRARKERELRMGVTSPGSMRLSDFAADSLARTGDQIRQSTRQDYLSAMKEFIAVVGDKDYQKVTLTDGEFFRQACLQEGNRPATVAKKLKVIKCIFQAAVRRNMLGENPLRYIRLPRYSQGEIHTFNPQECDRILQVAREMAAGPLRPGRPRWDLLILTALCTGLRRGELLNATWADVDFAEQTLRVAPKGDTVATWEWRIKDTDRRKLPLTEDLAQILADHQARQPEGYPYVFVPTDRYDYIQEQLRAKGKWTYSDSRVKVISGFNRRFEKLLERADIEEGEFHDFRRTAICNWFAQGLSELEVMKLAGHTDFRVTHRYYLKVRDDLLDRARAASDRALRANLAHFGTRPAKVAV